jgi:hypothetical protein
MRWTSDTGGRTECIESRRSFNTGRANICPGSEFGCRENARGHNFSRPNEIPRANVAATKELINVWGMASSQSDQKSEQSNQKFLNILS